MPNAPDGTITNQRSLKLKVVAAGDSYSRLKLAIIAYRMMFRRMNGIVAAAQAATSTFVPKKVIRKPKDITPDKAEKLAKRKIAEEEARLFLGVNVDHEKIRRLIIAWMGGNENEARSHYELRNVFFGTLSEELYNATEGQIRFGPHMFDQIRASMLSEREKIVTTQSGAKIPRNILEAAGEVDMLSVRNLGMQVMRTSGRNYAELIEDEHGIRMRLQWGSKNDAAEVVIEGKTVDANGKTWSRTFKNNKGAAKLVHQMITGELPYQTPVINVKDGALSLNVLYRRLSTPAALNANSVAHLDFFAIQGADLRQLCKTKNDTGADDDKLFVLHCSQGARKFRIPVNDVIADLKQYSQQRRKIELLRDCRRYWPRRLVNPLKERLANLTKQRALRERDANHVWAKRIIGMIASWNCGVLKLYGPPNGASYGLNGVADQKGSAEHPWNWYGFKLAIEYKAKERGIVVECVEHVQVQDTIARAFEMTEENDGEE